MSAQPPAFDWNKIVHKNVKSNDMRYLGNVTDVDNDSFILLHDADQKYRIPKSRVKDFNGNDVTVDFRFNDLLLVELASLSYLKSAERMTDFHGTVNLHRRFQELHTLKDKLGLPDAVIEKAAYIYRKARQRRLTLGRSNAVLLAAATYIACRELEVPKTLYDIAITSNTKRKVLSKEYRLLVTKLDLTVPIAEPIKCIAKVANRSNVSEKTKRKARLCVSSPQKNYLQERIQWVLQLPLFTWHHFIQVKKGIKLRLLMQQELPKLL